MPHGLDTDTQVDIYPCEFYCLHNFSAFKVFFEGHLFDTAEHAYQWAKFANWESSKIYEEPDYGIRRAYFTQENHGIRSMILRSFSAHAAYKIAQEYADRVAPDWSKARATVMLRILKAKADQHEYVKRKLLETGDRRIVEVDWRDSSSFWGTGSDGNGENMLGRLWMEIRCEIRLGESGV